MRLLISTEYPYEEVDLLEASVGIAAYLMQIERFERENKVIN